MNEMNGLPKFESESELESLEGKYGKIMVCTGSIDDYGDKIPEKFKALLTAEENDSKRPGGDYSLSSIDGVDNVSFHAGEPQRLEAGLMSGGPLQYVMSKVDGNDKFSSGFYSCIGLIVVGTDKETGENISMVLHTPPYDPNTEYEVSVLAKLINDIQQNISILKARSTGGSIDSMIIGGLVDETYGDSDRESDGKIRDFVSMIVEREIGTAPDRSVPAKYLTIAKKTSKELAKKSQRDTLYFDNKNRRLFLIRPEYLKD